MLANYWKKNAQLLKIYYSFIDFFENWKITHPNNLVNIHVVCQFSTIKQVYNRGTKVYN